MIAASEAIDYRAAAEKVAADLDGTCQSLDAALDRHGFDGFDNIMDFCVALDSLIWECKGCGWWMEPHEVDDDENCEQCREGDDE